LAGRMRTAWVRWVFYALLVIFAVDMLGIVLPFSPFRGVAVDYYIAGGLVVVVGMFLCAFYEFEDRWAKLANRVATQTSSLEPAIQSLKRTSDESATEAKRRIAELDLEVRNIGDGITGFNESFAEMKKEVADFAGKVEKLAEEEVSAVKEAFANNEKVTLKMAEAQSGVRRQAEAVDARLSKVEGGVRRLEEVLSRVEGSGRETEEEMEEAGERASKLEDDLGELKTSISKANAEATKTLEAVTRLEKKSNGIDGRVSSVAKSQARIPRLERSVSKIEGQLTKISKSEPRITRIERSVAKIEAKVTKLSPKPAVRSARRTRRRRPKKAAAPEPAQTVPEEVRQLEEEVQEPAEPPASEGPQESQESQEYRGSASQ